jgi:hypothetical protein
MAEGVDMAHEAVLPMTMLSSLPGLTRQSIASFARRRMTK